MQGETADRILHTAHSLVSERGYSAFSYADISDAVHISKASIHHHFPTKAKLVVSVLRAHRERLLKGFEALAQGVEDPLARLQAYVKYWEGCIRDNKEPFCIAALLAAELPSLPEEVRLEVQRHFQELSGWIGQTLEEGVSKHSLEILGSMDDEAQSFMAVVHGAMLSARALGNAAVFHAATTLALERLSTRSH